MSFDGRGARVEGVRLGTCGFEARSVESLSSDILCFVSDVADS